jgi:hypothetical protein
VLLIAFPRQQPLSERASALYLYVHCLSCWNFVYTLGHAEEISVTQFQESACIRFPRYNISNIYNLVKIVPRATTANVVSQKNFKFLTTARLRLTARTLHCVLRFQHITCNKQDTIQTSMHFSAANPNTRSCCTNLLLTLHGRANVSVLI